MTSQLQIFLVTAVYLDSLHSVFRPQFGFGLPDGQLLSVVKECSSVDSPRSAFYWNDFIY